MLPVDIKSDGYARSCLGNLEDSLEEPQTSPASTPGERESKNFTPTIFTRFKCYTPLRTMSDATSQRWINLDDIDSQIQYSGIWLTESYVRPGPPRALGDLDHGTATVTNATTANLFINYEGGNMAIWGGSNRPPGAEFAINCTVDGAPGQSGPIGRNEALHRWPLCRSADESIAVGRHEVNVYITSSHGTVAWIDTIAYYSSPNPDLKGKYSEIPAAPDQALQYFGMWDTLFGVDEARQTNTKGSKLSVAFHGTSVEVRGYLTASMPRKSSFATYSIDGGSEMQFTLPAYEGGFRGLSSRDTRWRVPLLITPPVANGPHTLSITYRGNSSAVPLTVDYFVVAHQGVAVTPSTNIVGPYVETTNTNTSPGDGTGSPKSRAGAIVGGVVGGTFILVALAFLLYWYKNSERRESKGEERTSLIPVPYDSDITPVHPPPRHLSLQPQSIPMVPTNRRRTRPASPSILQEHQIPQASGEPTPSEVSSSLGLSYVSSFASSPVHPLMYPGAQSDRKGRENLETY